MRAFCKFHNVVKSTFGRGGGKQRTRVTPAERATRTTAEAEFTAKLTAIGAK